MIFVELNEVLKRMTSDGGVVRGDSGELSNLVTPCRKGLTFRCDVEKNHKNQWFAFFMSDRHEKQLDLDITQAWAHTYAPAREGYCFLVVLVSRFDIFNQIKELLPSYLKKIGLSVV